MNIGRSEYLKMKEKEKELLKAERTLQQIKDYANSMNWKSIVRMVNECK